MNVLHVLHLCTDELFITEIPRYVRYEICNKRFVFYYINTSEIPGELSHVNMISSHMKITCYFTRENVNLFS